jgi:hypothetical protein
MVKRRRTTPDCLKDRDKLTKEEFGKKYFGHDKRLEKIAIGFLAHLEKTYNLDLSGLQPEDHLCDILGQRAEEQGDEYETPSSTVRKALKLYIDYKPFEKYLKHSTWDITTIRHRSIGGIIREIGKDRND